MTTKKTANTEARRAASREYYRKHRTEILRRMRQYHAENREQMAEKAKRRWREHRQSEGERYRRYCETHREVIARRNQRYYAKHQARLRERSREYVKTHPRGSLMRRARGLLLDAQEYVRQAAGIELRTYQTEALGRILESVSKQQGDTIVIVFPRQSGKDELLVNLKVLLLDRYAPLPLGIVEINPTYQPQTVNALRRFDANLGSNNLLRGQWRKRGVFMRTVGLATVTFLSGDKSANVVGATASLLLIVNEAQDIEAQVYRRKFEPMAASTNATRVFAGTVWTSKTLLAEEMRAAREAERGDGRKRVFVIDAEEVRKHAPKYGEHVQAVIEKQGRQHPLVKTQYFNEEIDAQTGMFHAGRRALMKCDHGPRTTDDRQGSAEVGGQRSAVAFCIDVAGQDEGMLRLEGLGNPGRDATTVSIVEIDLSSLKTLQAPTYRVVERHAWQGENHVSVFGKIKALAEAWGPQKIVVDATGVGEGLWAMLDKAFPTRVMPVKFTQQSKSEMGYGFLAIIETGRFRDCAPSAAVDLQYESCQSEILPGPQHTMRWGVPDGRRGPDGELVHDDYIVADAMTAELDRLEWNVRTKLAFTEPKDALEEMSRFR